MKKQHIILFPVIIMLYIIYLIIDYKYNEYKINSHINNIITTNESLREKILETTELIDYKSSRAYINKILKQEQQLKNKGEQVLQITSQQQYEKFTQDTNTVEAEVIIAPVQVNITQNMTIKQKWLYFLFKNDTR